MTEADAMTKLCPAKMAGGQRGGEALCEGTRCMAGQSWTVTDDGQCDAVPGLWLDNIARTLGRQVDLVKASMADKP